MKECYRILKNNTKYKNNDRECKKVCNFMEEVHGILRRIWNAKEEYAMSNGSGWIHKEQ